MRSSQIRHLYLIVLQSLALYATKDLPQPHFTDDHLMSAYIGLIRCDQSTIKFTVASLLLSRHESRSTIQES